MIEVCTYIGSDTVEGALCDCIPLRPLHLTASLSESPKGIYNVLFVCIRVCCQHMQVLARGILLHQQPVGRGSCEKTRGNSLVRDV